MKSLYNYSIGEVWDFAASSYSDLPFTASLNGRNFTYKKANSVIDNLISHLELTGIETGSRIALLSENRSEWGLCWLAAVTSSRIAVPIMTDFAAEQIQNILEHSDASFIFISEKMLPKIRDTKLFSERKFLLIDEAELFDKPDTALSISEYSPASEDTAAIIYTSGTTGTSKGVMLSHKNIVVNACDSTLVGGMEAGDALLSVLPLAHMYEFTQGFMLPILEGANITYLGMKPSPRLMLDAIAKTKPHFILSVPLLIEKIYRSSVLKNINSSKVLKTVYKILPVRKLLNRFVIGKKLMKTFGGRLKFFGIGGAPLSEDVERFLREAKFPYAVGYGLTETAPCLAGSPPNKSVFRGPGQPFKSVELRILDGEIQVKSDCVMQGYYLDEERTAEVFTEDGWFRTGDIGELDAAGNLYVKGRIKNVILGPAGENIYPEEIENILKTDPVVAECLVLGKGSELVARVMLDEEKLKQYFEELKHNISHFPQWKEEFLENMRKKMNTSLSSFSKISRIIEQEVPFELTPSLKIRRFLYQN